MLSRNAETEIPMPDTTLNPIAAVPDGPELGAAASPAQDRRGAAV